ncbi:MAG: DUF72 domain-containing protein [Desulfurococcales archaeon]|nr:DUF72 domain-containing protein [Desulfurococcales archaeon]
MKKEMSSKNIYIGTCGFPRKREEIYKKLDVAEIQETFYDLISEDRALKIVSSKPEHFKLTAKVFQGITHHSTSPTWRRSKTKLSGDLERYGLLRPTTENLKLWEKQLELFKILKVEIAVFQTPPSFDFSDENIRNVKEFFSSIDRDSLKIAWEPRGGWNKENNKEILCKILSELDVIHIVDIFRNTPCIQETSYIRLHGIGGGEVNYRYKYKDEDLNILKEKIFNLYSKEIYVLFNNVYMFDDAIRFKEILRGGLK